MVFKPTDSAGSDGVKLCQTFEEAKEHFNHLLTVVIGGLNTEVFLFVRDSGFDGGGGVVGVGSRQF